jgi:hypothetical protein
MMAIDEEPLEAEFQPLAIREEQTHAPDLFGSADPVEIVDKAVRVANALKAVVVSKNLISNIQGKPYPQVEAWLCLASMLRLTTVCEWSRQVPDGWEARVFVRDGANNVIGAAEAQCLKTERTKKSWEDYAIRSMAQTRATSKALRSVLGFIMVLAGYQATPAEEMPDAPEPSAEAVKEAFRLDEPEPPKRTLKAVEEPQEDPLTKERKRMWAIVKDKRISEGVRLATILRLFGAKAMTDGKPSTKGLSHAQMCQLNFELSEWSGA